MDTGYTEHSGCPIVKGEKWIATAWLREGVSAEDSWMRFDPEGIPLMALDSDQQASDAAGATVTVPSSSRVNSLHNHQRHAEEL